MLTQQPSGVVTAGRLTACWGAKQWASRLTLGLTLGLTMGLTLGLMSAGMLLWSGWRGADTWASSSSTTWSAAACWAATQLAGRLTIGLAMPVVSAGTLLWAGWKGAASPASRSSTTFCVFRTHQRSQQIMPIKFLRMLSLNETDQSMLVWQRQPC